MDTVSVIVPVYNEELYIEAFVDSLLKQDYDFSKLEVILVDGNSTDETLRMLKEKMANVPFSYKILNNEKRITPVSLNIAIKESKNDIIVRLDVHSEYPSNYISKCVYYLNNTDADNVGCTLETKSKGKIGNAISNVLSSKFGVGDSKFRTNSKSGYVDTVPFGTFRKSLFEKIGYFNEKLERNQDSEFNSRIIKNGGKIYLFNDINLIYHPRDTITKLAKMARQNGKWNILTSYYVPGSMRLRHFIPLMFDVSLIIGLVTIIFNVKILKYLFFIELLLYLLLDCVFSIKDIRKNGIIISMLCFIIFPIFHISYGIGSIIGIEKVIKNRIYKR